MRHLAAWLALINAGLEKWATEITEVTKTFSEREYWRGYTDAMQDRDVTIERRPDG